MSRGRGKRSVVLRIDSIALDGEGGDVMGISGAIIGDRGATEEIYIKVGTRGWLYSDKGRKAKP